MSQGPPSEPSLFTQVDISAASGSASPSRVGAGQAEQTQILQQILSAQDRQNELLEELVSQLGAPQRQRAAELNQWKEANPELARSCRQAAETLGRVQARFLESLTEEVSYHGDSMADGEFLMAEFVDRFGPRLAHLNGVLQVLTQLGANPPHPGPSSSST